MAEHVPVLLDEVVEHLGLSAGEAYVDCTFGAGGYSSAIIQRSGTTLYAFDLDPDVAKTAQVLKKKLGRRGKDFHFTRGNFSEIKSTLGDVLVDGIVADLGVSSMQIDIAERGFSFQKDGPLDMRMSKSGLSAYEVVNRYEEEELANIIYKYGEERKSRRIARAIVKERETSPIETTSRLAEVIRGAFAGQRKKKIDFATKTFQAIRIFVNGELENLKKLLEVAEEILKENGRLIVVSFHALEDRLVKNFINDKANYVASPSRYIPEVSDGGKRPSFKMITKKPVIPSQSEIDRNVRARSAKLRVAVRINREVADA